MNYLVKALIVFIAGGCSLLAAADVLDCSRRSLADAVEKAKSGDTIHFSGICRGPVLITTDNITLSGKGAAAVDGRGMNAIVVYGAHGISLNDFEVRQGENGILGQNGAAIALNNIVSRNNKASGLSLQTGSSAMIQNSTSKDNDFHGLDLQTGASATVTGSFTASGNKIFGINVNGSSLTFSKATVSLTANTLGMQVATAANAFINDPATTLEVTNNLATGLTVVSGAHMVSFGGRITSTGNGVFGVSVNSKGGLDLDAGSVLTASGNRAGGITLQHESVMTAFNNPQFSGATGVTTITVSNNGGNGVAVLTDSRLTFSNQAQLSGTTNGAFGLFADNGGAVTLRNTTLSSNAVRDLSLSFGARADIQTGVTVGTASCDATVLIRGASFACTP